MIFDAKVPAALKKSQQWFASIITRPIDACSLMEPVSPSGIPMEVEAAEYITPSPTLQPHERIQIYNQQYWWRFLTTLHENFPFVTRLFGYREFNRIFAFPYIVKYPASHWSLNYLGDRLPQWIEEEYHEGDKPLVQHAAELDLGCVHSFYAKNYPSLQGDALSGDEDKLMAETLYLQPHVQLFELPFDLLKVRDQMLSQSPEYWMENDFPLPEREKPSYTCAIYRNRQQNVFWDYLHPAAYQILLLFKKGTNIENICEWIEQQPEEIVSEASTRLHLWFQEWTMREWLYTSI